MHPHVCTCFIAAYTEFDIVSSPDFVTQNLPYDSMSFMHFDHSKYSENGGDTLQGSQDILDFLYFGLRKVPNKLDYLHINLLYCGGKQQWRTIYGYGFKHDYRYMYFQSLD